MSAADKRLSWGQAKSEVICHWTEISKRLAEGAPASTIYRDMVARGLVGCADKSFYKVIAHLRREGGALDGPDTRGRPHVSTPVSPCGSARQTTLMPSLVSDGPVMARAGPPDGRYFEDDEDQPSREEGKALLRGERRLARQSP